ncbi:hypothetical protein [Streptomyces sp. NPDC001415]
MTDPVDPGAARGPRAAPRPIGRRGRLAARDPELAPEAADRLTRDPDADVRDAFARHPRLPLPRIMELLDDEELTHAAAANPALPAATMRRLAGTPRHEEAP